MSSDVKAIWSAMGLVRRVLFYILVVSTLLMLSPANNAFVQGVAMASWGLFSVSIGWEWLKYAQSQDSRQ